MFNVIVSSQFKKDLKRASKRGKDINKIEVVVNVLQIGGNLEIRHRNHRLAGTWSLYWECHIEPDWLLIYQFTETELILVRTDSHSDLFD